MKYQLDFLKAVSTDPDKVYEISIKKVKSPFSVIDIGGIAALHEYRALNRVAYLEAKVVSAAKYAIVRERAIALMTSNLETTGKDVMPETGETLQVFQRCECGSEAIGSKSHSSWCQIFENALSPRAKTSFVPVRVDE